MHDAGKGQKKKSTVAPDEPSQRTGSPEATWEFVDNRVETAQLRKLQATADNSPQAARIAKIAAISKKSATAGSGSGRPAALARGRTPPDPLPVQRLSEQVAKALVPFKRCWATGSAESKHKAVEGATEQEAREKLRDRPDEHWINTVIDISDANAKKEIRKVVLDAEDEESLGKTAPLSKAYHIATAQLPKHMAVSEYWEVAKVTEEDAKVPFVFSKRDLKPDKGRLGLYHPELPSNRYEWGAADNKRVADRRLKPHFPGLDDLNGLSLDRYLKNPEIDIATLDVAGIEEADVVTAFGLPDRQALLDMIEGARRFRDARTTVTEQCPGLAGFLMSNEKLTDWMEKQTSEFLEAVKEQANAAIEQAVLGDETVASLGIDGVATLLELRNTIRKAAKKKKRAEAVKE